MFGTDLRTLYNKNDSSSLEMNNFKDSVPSSYLENECGICSQMLRRHHIYSEVSNCRGGYYKRGGLAISRN